MKCETNPEGTIGEESKETLIELVNIWKEGANFIKPYIEEHYDEIIATNEANNEIYRDLISEAEKSGMIIDPDSALMIVLFEKNRTMLDFSFILGEFDIPEDKHEKLMEALMTTSKLFKELKVIDSKNNGNLEVIFNTIFKGEDFNISMLHYEKEMLSAGLNYNMVNLNKYYQ